MSVGYVGSAFDGAGLMWIFFCRWLRELPCYVLGRFKTDAPPRPRAGIVRRGGRRFILGVDRCLLPKSMQRLHGCAFPIMRRGCGLQRRSLPRTSSKTITPGRRFFRASFFRREGTALPEVNHSKCYLVMNRHARATNRNGWPRSVQVGRRCLYVAEGQRSAKRAWSSMNRAISRRIPGASSSETKTHDPCQRTSVRRRASDRGPASTRTRQLDSSYQHSP